MASIDFTEDPNKQLHKEIFEEYTWKQKINASYFSRFMTFPGLSSNHIQIGGKTEAVESAADMPIIVKRTFANTRGAQVSFNIIQHLTGKGITGSSGKTIEGNEENLESFRFTIGLEEYGHGLIDTSPLGRQRTVFHIPGAMTDALSAWAIKKFDTNCFEAIEDNPTTVLYPGETATSTSTLTATDKLTMDFLHRAKIYAQTSASGSRYLMEPFRFKGRDFFFCLASPEAMYDLKSDPEYKEAELNALQRGDKYSHPIFAGADAISAHGVVVFSHEDVSTYNNWGASGNISGSKLSFFGNKALVYAQGPAGRFVRQTGDYERQEGYAYTMMHRVSKPKFNNKDYGSMQLRVAHSNLNIR